MDKTLTIRKWDAGRTGVNVSAHGIHIQAELYGQESNGILLYDKKGSAPIRLDFTDEMRTGNTYDCMLAGISPQDYTYLFHEDRIPVMDRRAKACSGHRLFGAEHIAAGEADALKGCSFVVETFNWQGDKQLKTSYEDSVYYGMHVRGFTKDASSRIKEAGTFAGVQKKIPYLLKLGVTGVVLQPVYEFEECMPAMEIRTVSDAVSQAGKEPEMRLNYWGYVPGYYFAPKNAYAYSENTVAELKTLVRTLHKNGLEIILQFYFEPSMSCCQISEILKYWIHTYHIDGFELMGAALPLAELASDPFFADTKLWNEGFPCDKIARIKMERCRSTVMERGKRHSRHAESKPSKQEKGRFLASCNMDYENTIRQFLKGDSNMVSSFLFQQRDNPPEQAKINYLASYHGFRLADLVSYDRKHNEANGEENRDGENNNYSWNCGAEGETRRKNILALRTKQMKNALVMLFTAQGTPFLFMGDEWGKSAEGNNNPYCQDNGITWQKWNLKKTEREMLSFTAQMIAFRKKHLSLHQKKPLQMLDYLSCGYPDLSYHGREAWRPDLGYYVRHIGVMICGKYSITNNKEEECLYIAYNMHWEPSDFALPRLEKGKGWKLLLDTEGQSEDVPQKEQETTDGVRNGIDNGLGNGTESGIGNGIESGIRNGIKDGIKVPEGGAGEEIQETSAQTVTLPGRSVRIYVSGKLPVGRKGKKKV